MMTKKSRAAKLDLARDIESYTCGERPSPLAMMRAPKLEQWYTAVRRRGKEFVMVICGEVHGHPEIAEGMSISTPAIMWRDRKDRFVRTATRLYRLGEQIGREIPIDGVDT